MRKKIITLIKLIILAAIFYALLAFNVFHLGEKLVPSTKDYLEVNIPTEDTTLEERYLEMDIGETGTGHGAASIAGNIDDLCATANICDKIAFNGKYTQTEKYTYLKILTKLTRFINTNNTEDKDIDDVIERIEINNENGKRRGYATRDTIIFNIGSVQSNKEFIDLSSHEMGHITDLGYLQGATAKKDRNFTEFGKVVFSLDDISIKFYGISWESETIRKSTAKKKDFCSGYGMTDPFEDFSECFNLYLNHNIFFREIAKTNITLKKKYNFIAGIFKGKHISSSNADLELVKQDKERRPRDTTKISN